MNNSKPGKLIMSSESWKDELKVLEDENIRFKTRLADILATGFHKDQLERLEYFQNKFLKMDEQISLLRHEVREQLHLQQQPALSNGQLKKTMNLQRRLEVKMIIIHEYFDKLSAEFNNYLQEKPA
jgi:hypothetical protein